MDGKVYKRWALDCLREQAEARGFLVSGRKDEPRLLLREIDGLHIFYQGRWWRSAFKQSGYGGSFGFDLKEADQNGRPVVVLLLNLGDFFIPIRSPESVAEVDHFLDRLIQLADWCAEEKLEEFRELALRSGEPILRLELAAKHLREFPFRASASKNGDVC